MRPFQFLMLVVLAVLAQLVRPIDVRAQELSCITVSIIVPTAVGSAGDLVGRAVADAATKLGGPAFRVRNRPRDIARQLIEDAAPNGCTLMLDTQIQVAFEVLGKGTTDWREFKPIALLTRTPMAIVLSAGGPPPAAPKGEEPEPPSLFGIVAGLRDKPESVTFALVDDPLEQLLFLRMEEALGARFRIRSYANGIARYRELVRGPAGVAGFVSFKGAASRIKGKQLNVLAVSGAFEPGMLPGVPTIGSEADGLTFGIDHGLFGPRDMPNDIVKTLAETMRSVMETRGVLADLHNEYGTEAALITGDGFARYLENLSADWGEMLQRQDNGGRLGQKS
ncbi:tripartite tricarboxylate transporter substrate-binding protein [Nisaea sp.]|uniref:tripartite tricarboxylate transporter substrate-binding protein n=1 Tax=Nisaea sp. TaxID=2024842 RepID=UPI0032641BC0